MTALVQQTTRDWADKGMALEFQGKYNEAVQAYDEAIRLDPNYSPAKYNKATLWLTKAMRNQSG